MLYDFLAVTKADKSSSVSILRSNETTCCRIIERRLDMLQVGFWIQLVQLETGVDVKKKKGRCWKRASIQLSVAELLNFISVNPEAECFLSQVFGMVKAIVRLGWLYCSSDSSHTMAQGVQGQFGRQFYKKKKDLSIVLDKLNTLGCNRKNVESGFKLYIYFPGFVVTSE